MHTNDLVLIVCFVLFDSLRPINNLSVIQGRVFLDDLFCLFVCLFVCLFD